jgi:hypothetical protein
MNTELNIFLGPVILSLSGRQHGLGDELHLTNKLLIFLRNVWERDSTRVSKKFEFFYFC